MEKNKEILWIRKSATAQKANQRQVADKPRPLTGTYYHHIIKIQKMEQEK